MSDLQMDKNSYLAFDALTLKQHIKDMLTKGGVWTDQNYEGSNISTVVDIVSYTFNVLMFYLNKSSSENMFSDAQIYENMNRVVQLLDYKPIGNQTATLSFTASALGTGETANASLYTLPRYSYFQLNGVPYSFNEDITFSKTVTGDEELTDLSDNKLLYQGKFEEYPVYTAIGQENEIVFLTPGQNIIIDHFNVHVYVKPITTKKWEQWNPTTSLYLNTTNDSVYELRFNENKNYEIKFGNGINGRKLNTDDEVAIYYLSSKGSNGEVGVGVLDGKVLTKYQTVQFNTIFTDVVNNQYQSMNDFTSLSFTNDSVSTYSGKEEDVDSIRKNAPGVFRSQYRLVTEGDYENYVKTNFANLINDVKTVNNWKYLSEYLKYYYDLGISKPSDISRALYNQVQFGDSCNFNNIYIFIVPRISTNSKIDYSYVLPSQKELILSSMKSEKTLTSEVIVMDPNYLGVNLAIPLVGAATTLDDINNTELLVIKEPNSRRDNNSIANDVNNVFVNYFSRSNATLGQTIDVKKLTSDILSINGVKTFYTRRTDDTSVSFEGLSLLVFNPIYANDIRLAIKNLTLSYFEYPYLYDKDNFSGKITVQLETKIYENVEY